MGKVCGAHKENTTHLRILVSHARHRLAHMTEPLSPSKFGPPSPYKFSVRKASELISTVTGPKVEGEVERLTELPKVKFGRSDMLVTTACAGTMTWGSFNANEEQAFAQLDKLMEMGVNFIDTAELYPVAFN